MSGEALLPASLSVCWAECLGQLETQGIFLQWQWQRYKKNGSTANANFVPCLLRSLTKASCRADLEVKGWGSTLAHAYMGDLQSYLGRDVDRVRGEELAPNVIHEYHSVQDTSLYCSKNTDALCYLQPGTQE